jgi:hypothetical protein
MRTFESFCQEISAGLHVDLRGLLGQCVLSLRLNVWAQIELNLFGHSVEKSTQEADYLVLKITILNSTTVNVNNGPHPDHTLNKNIINRNSSSCSLLCPSSVFLISLGVFPL